MGKSADLVRGSLILKQTKLDFYADAENARVSITYALNTVPNAPEPLNIN